MRSIGGGMETYTLNYGTKTAMHDMAKSLIEELSPGGEYIFTTNRNPQTE
jgi:hypothetical protein